MQLDRGGVASRPRKRQKALRPVHSFTACLIHYRSLWRNFDATGGLRMALFPFDLSFDPATNGDHRLTNPMALALFQNLRHHFAR